MDEMVEEHEEQILNSIDYVTCDLYAKSDKSSPLKHKSLVKVVKDIVVFLSKGDVPGQPALRTSCNKRILLTLSICHINPF